MTDLRTYGFDPAFWPRQEMQNLGRVTAVYPGRYQLVCARGPLSGCLKTAAYAMDRQALPTVGDFVRLEAWNGGMARILETLPRKTFFSRLDPSSAGHAAQAVAANFDYVFLLQSLNQDFNLRRLERYITMAWQSGAVPVVILTKRDLNDHWVEQVQAAQTVSAGAKVHAVSARTKEGLAALSAYLRPRKTVVFLGSSGVGKSSLLNALAGETVMEVGEIREDDGRGRHTTTNRQLQRLNSGAMVIDTPGMRELGLWDALAGLEQSFADVEQYFSACRFRDCRHQTEPGCAVRAAIADGTLPTERWESYQKLLREAGRAGKKSRKER